MDSISSVLLANRLKDEKFTDDGREVFAIYCMTLWLKLVEKPTYFHRIDDNINMNSAK
jgi:hypothetical protein